MKVLLVVAQVEYWVEHQLPGAVIGYLTAALCAVQRKGRGIAVEAQVVQGAAGAQGEHRGVLQEYHMVGGWGVPCVVLLLYVVQQALLQCQCLWSNDRGCARFCKRWVVVPVRTALAGCANCAVSMVCA